MVNALAAGALIVAVAVSRHAFPEIHMNRKTLLMLAVLAALSAGTALAATAPARDSHGAPRAKLDTNGDGAIDRSEAARSPRLADRFDELDKNKDGKLAKEEMPRRDDRGRGKRGHDRHGMMMKLDSDQDGRISRAEATAGQAGFAARFDEMDVNKDGFIDKADRELRMKQRTDAWFTAADTDKDGKLSRAEFDAAKQKQHAAHGRSPRPAPAKPAN